MTSHYHLQKSILTIGVVLFFAFFGVSSAGAQDSIATAPHIKKLLVDNDEVRAYLVRIKPGEKEPMHSHPAFVAYSFTDSMSRHTHADGKVRDMELKAGDIVYSDGMSHAVENIGSSELFALVVELKQAKSGKVCSIEAATDPAKVAAEQYKAIFENDRVRLVDVFYKPGEKAVMHSHPPSLAYFLTSFQAKFIFPDGTSQALEGKADEVIVHDGFSHAVENTGSTAVHVLLVEFKDIASFHKKLAANVEKVEKVEKVENVENVENVEIVKGMYAAFHRGDIRAILEACAEDIEWQSPGPTEIPFSGVRRGRTQVEEFFGILAKTLKFDKFEPQEFISDRDTVVVLGCDSGSVVATGRAFGSAWAMVFHLRHGKVVRFCEFYDTAVFSQAFHHHGK